MVISVINKKGGVGKTPIAFSIAKDLDYNLTSNDTSVIESIYAKAKIEQNPMWQNNTVYDFGGFVSSYAKKILERSDFVIVPCSNDYNSILRTVETIDEIQNYTQNIILVATKIEKESDFLTIRDAINERFENIYFFELRNSKIFKNSIETGMSVIELSNENPLSKSAYRTVSQQYNNLLNIFR